MTNLSDNHSRHRIKVSIRGFAAFQPTLRGNMSMFKVGVQVNPLKRDYYDVLLFGPKARYAVKTVQKGSIVEVEGSFDYSVRRSRNGRVKARLVLTANDFSFGRRGDEHYATGEAVGELATHPYKNRTMNGTEVSSFEMKVNRQRKGKAKTTRMDVSVFGGSATACNAHLYRGRSVEAKGKLRLAVFEGRDGVEKGSVDLVAERVTFLSHKVESPSGLAA